MRTQKLTPKWLAFVLMLAALLPLSGRPVGAQTLTPTRYTALGDSIAYGIGSPTLYGYVPRFRDYLVTATGQPVALANFGVPGIKTGDLLFMLRWDVPRGIRAAVRDAHILTISIGGNNLLQYSHDSYNTFDTAGATREMETVRSHWLQILQQIRGSIGSRARLYVMTLYNPYEGDDPLYPTIDRYVRGLNAARADPAYQSGYGYKIADVYAHFAGAFPDGTWKTCAWTYFCAPYRDPHPTDAGHAEIAAVHAAVYP